MGGRNRFRVDKTAPKASKLLEHLLVTSPLNTQFPDVRNSQMLVRRARDNLRNSELSEISPK
ncbi:hypothetical protein J6590_092033 [Homalodisca vitripennis]|nr:hypothetical protein J6590_092033 [Homalodisca vitripennis]